MNIHAAVPGHKRTAMHDLANRLAGILPMMLGRENARTSGWIMQKLGEKSAGTNQRLRAAAKYLLVERNVPIISCNDGFFVAGDRSELLQYQQSLKSRIEGLYRDISAVDRILDGDAFRDRQKSLDLSADSGCA